MLLDGEGNVYGSLKCIGSAGDSQTVLRMAYTIYAFPMLSGEICLRTSNVEARPRWMNIPSVVLGAKRIVPRRRYLAWDGKKQLITK